MKDVLLALVTVFSGYVALSLLFVAYRRWTGFYCRHLQVAQICGLCAQERLRRK